MKFLILLIPILCFGQFEIPRIATIHIDSTYWETVEVMCEGSCITKDTTYTHDWVYGEEYGAHQHCFIDLFCNRICRNCLRHEKQVGRIWAPPQKISEYDSLLKVLEKNK